MTKTKLYDSLFFLILVLFSSVLIYSTCELSISYKEALNVFDNMSLLTLITLPLFKLFGYSDIALRLPFILFYIATIIMMYIYTKDYFKYDSDRFVNILIFMFLPGVLSASLLVNSAIIVTFCTLVYLYYYKKHQEHPYVLLLLFLFVDNSFAIFYLALFFYALKQKDNKLLVVSLILFSLSMYIYGFTTYGKPKSHLLDMFAIYASVFSPLLFIYFLYAMYRIGIKGERDLSWYISVTALSFSFIFAFRQKVYIEDFAPYVIITLPMMVKLFFHTLRIRLHRFRTKHYMFAYATLILLFINATLTFANKPLYLLLDNPKKHFAYKYHFAKEIAQILKDNNIDEIFSDDLTLTKRLQFYNINKGMKYFVTIRNDYKYGKVYHIKYLGKNILTFYVVKFKENEL